MTEEYKQSEVTFKYYLPDNREDMIMHMLAPDMYSVLHEIDQKCRSHVKYDDKATQESVDFAEEIREFIHSSIDLDKIS